MKKSIIFLMLLALLLCGCQARPAESTAPAETTLPVTETSLPAPETTAPVSEEPVISDLQPGYYLLSSVGKDGDVQFYGSLDAENGYLQLNDDGTGILCYEGTEAPLTWSGQELVWQGQTLMGFRMSYYDSELGREDAMIALYFLDPVVSLCFRPVPGETP